MYHLHLYQLVFPASQANFFTMLQAAFVLGIYRRIFEMIVTIAEVCFLHVVGKYAVGKRLLL